MSIGAKTLKMLNKVFKLPVHPWNTQLEGGKTYAEWQFDNGEKTIMFYNDYINPYTMFKEKTVLDVGCGAGGKSLYYVKLGAKKVIGIDIVDYYKEESELLKKKLNLSDFEFYCEDASNTSFEDNTFDIVIMNDAMEHVADPESVLKESYRILKPGGKLFCNFPPYYHPYGAHLSDAIAMPWVHLFFSEKTLIEVYKDFVINKPDGEERIKFRISKNKDGEEYFSYINKMTIKRFKQIQKSTNFKVVFYRETPLKNFLKPLCHGFFKEYFVKMVVCVFEK